MKGKATAKRNLRSFCTLRRCSPTGKFICRSNFIYCRANDSMYITDNHTPLLLSVTNQCLIKLKSSFNIYAFETESYDRYNCRMQQFSILIVNSTAKVTIFLFQFIKFYSPFIKSNYFLLIKGNYKFLRN